MKRIVPLTFIILFLFTSCSTNVPCPNQFITPAFIGFTLTDLDTVIVRKYQKNDNFSYLLDTSIVISDTNFLKSLSSNDTTILLLNGIYLDGKYLFTDHDWQIFIPARNMIVSLSNFDSPQTDKKCTFGGDLCPTCWNSINSFLQNGQQVTPQYDSIKYYAGSVRAAFTGYLTYVHR